jgi:hypothetical protein
MKIESQRKTILIIGPLYIQKGLDGIVAKLKMHHKWRAEISSRGPQ